jgi:hypothetical protein
VLGEGDVESQSSRKTMMGGRAVAREIRSGSERIEDVPLIDWRVSRRKETIGDRTLAMDRSGKEGRICEWVRLARTVERR